jgi:hypothetical protein
MKRAAAAALRPGGGWPATGTCGIGSAARRPACWTASRARDRCWPERSGSDPIAVLSVLCHLLWCQELVVDLRMPLHERAAVQVGAGA